jgi:hypothetical protein
MVTKRGVYLLVLNTDKALPFEKFSGDGGTPDFQKYWAGTIHLHMTTSSIRLATRLSFPA